MSYENPEVPHEVNVARENAVMEFLRLAAGIGVCVLAVGAVLYFAGGQLARLIPFTTEQAWVGDTVLGFDIDGAAAAEHAEVERYLQALGGALASHMDLPETMRVTFHHSDMAVPNAFATLGGHIVVTAELYRLMPSENALAMVLAHEIAHVKARDPIAGVGGGASLALLVALVSGAADGLVPQLAALVQRGYSRRAESRADEAAVAALVAHYGHAGGAASVFEALAAHAGPITAALPPFLSTHPADDARIAALAQAADRWNPEREPLVPKAPRPGPDHAEPKDF